MDPIYGSQRLRILAQQLRLYRPPSSSSFSDEDENEESGASGKVVSHADFAESAAPISNPAKFKTKRAAVLICLFESDAGDLRVILTKRSSNLSTHAGEVSLPGGKVDEGDVDDIHTATREAKEEIGLDPSLVTIVTVLEPFISKVGDFATDNRAGISRTLHRISAIRNRKGVIIGLTCRVGRAISGSANLLRDLVKDGDSLLLIGPPGVGKTTIIREIARMLADDHSKRVMIVDTSNEIGGDGDIPHEGIGAARRMQVPNSDMQHKVLIEAVENHMPQVIVIDEISTKLEAVAASTIAQRGIQLVSTAHGVTIENLIMNPSLEMLVGGIQSVTLGDEEASRRGVQKTVLERRGPSTFTCGVEIISKTELRVHRSLEATVDALLSGRSPKFEVRKINSQGFAHEMVAVPIEPFSDISSHEQDEIVDGDLLEINDERISYNEFTSEFAAKVEEIPSRDEVQLRLYVYGILEASVVQAIKGLRMDDVVELTDNISKADAFLALFSKLKKNSRIQAVAKSHDIPIYVTKTSSLLQITKAIRAFVSKHADGFKDLEAEDKMISSEKIDALEEARLAIEQIVIPKGEPVELLPRSPAIRSLQMDLAKKYQLQSEKVGEEPDARVCILPLHATRTEGNEFDDGLVDSVGNFNNSSSPSDINGSYNSMTKLPFLPD